MNSTTTTIFGNWTTVEPYSASMRETVRDALGDFIADFDVDGLMAAFGDAINEALPVGISLCGDEFIVNVTFNGDITAVIREAYESVDFWAIARQHDVSEQAIKAAPKIGRPVVGPEIKVRISDDDLKALDDLAEKNGQSRAATARRLISRGLLAREKPVFVEVGPEKATHTIEAYRWGANTIDGSKFVGEDLAVWIAENTLDDDVWEWLNLSGINVPDVWFLVCPEGEGLSQRPIAALPIAAVG